MQFHLNGYRAGDPHDLYDDKDDESPSFQTLPPEVDVLIVGCGPAGLLLAAQLSLFPDIKVGLVEQKSERLTVGQADGVQCRTIEMFEAFGFREKVLKEAYWVNETTFWKPAADGEGVVRSGRIPDTEEGLSEFPHVILNQARIHDLFLENMKRSPTRLEPTYSRRLVDLHIDRSDSTGKQNGAASASASHHAVTAKLERLDAGHQGETETVRARYVVGCDGARSAVRRFMGLALSGDSANQAWGVMDVLAVTDFPDVRFKAVIHSADQGNMLIIPREGGYMIRMYIELDKLAENERVATRHLTSEHLIQAAQRILHPYTLDVKEVPWWSVYEIGQRLCERFDDVPSDLRGTLQPRVFITGDACHTHSPKAGQGMNVAMGDAYNLGWKLAAVHRGQATPDLLHTYSLERQDVAQQLIDFDREIARLFSARARSDAKSLTVAPKSAMNGTNGDDADDADDADGVDPAEFQKYFQRSGYFMAGVATTYSRSLVTGPLTHQHLATGLIVGMRFQSVQMVRLTDAKPVHLGHTIKADGRWRLILFGDSSDPRDALSALHKTCDYLANDSTSPIRRYTPAKADVDSVIDVRAVLQQSHTAINLFQLPKLLRPQKGKYGLIDQEKVYCDEKELGDASGTWKGIYDLRGVSKENGALVVVRPDQYIAAVMPLDGSKELRMLFDGFMRPAE